MESLSEYIPLLLIIGSIIVSAISGSKKKKKEVVSHETRIPGIPPGEPAKPSNRTFQEKAEHKELRLESIKQTNTKVKSNPNQRIYMKHSSQTSVFEGNEKILEIEDESVQPYIDLSDPDEVKKAVVYSEIFTRKDY
jgi:hypothetical protein